MKNKGLLAVFIFNSLIHILIYNNSPLQFDELLTFNLIKEMGLIDIIKFLFLTEVQMPLQYLIIKLVSYISLDSFWLRLPTLLINLALPYITYKNARFTLNEPNALMATFLVSLSYPMLYFSHSMRPYILLTATFSCCMYFLRLSLLNHHIKNHFSKGLIISIILLALSHPAGTISAIFIATVFLFKKKRGKYDSIYLTVFLGVITCLYFIIRKDIFTKMSFDEKTLEVTVHYLYKFSFITSGIWFSVFLFLLIVIANWNHKSHLDRFNFFWFSIPLIISIILIPFFGTFLYPRHIIFVVPALMYLTIELISQIPKAYLRTLLYGLSFITLLIKGFIVEKLHSSPTELESDKIAIKMKELSANKWEIVNCGNCFSYYIDDPLICMSTRYDYNQIEHINEKFVYLELDFVKDTCGVQHINRRIRKLEEHRFKGGNVYLMDLSPLHDK